MTIVSVCVCVWKYKTQTKTKTKQIKVEKRSQPISKMENCQRTLNLTTKEMQERNEREERGRVRRKGRQGTLPQFTVKRCRGRRDADAAQRCKTQRYFRPAECEMHLPRQLFHWAEQKKNKKKITYTKKWRGPRLSSSRDPRSPRYISVCVCSVCVCGVCGVCVANVGSVYGETWSGSGSG